MVKRWHGFRNPWDREYAMRGPLWRGAADATFLSRWADASQPVLELGCGDGKFLRALAAAGHRATGLDSSRKGLLLARGESPSPLILADVRRLPLRARSQPVVAARHVLGALLEADRRVAAGEIERVLQPGGTLVVEEFTPRDFRFGAGRAVEAGTFERNRGISTHYFEPEEMDSLFTGSRVLHHEEFDSRQMTAEGRKARHRARWILRPYGPTEPNESNRADDARKS